MSVTSSKIKNIGENVEEKLVNTGEKLKNASQNLAEASDEKIEKVRNEFYDKKSTLEDSIINRPLTSIAIAAGLGFLASKLFSNK